MLEVVSVVAVLCAGLMAGLLFGDWLGPAFARSKMSLSNFIQFQQIIHDNYLKVLPAISSGALLGASGWLVLLWQRGAGGPLLALMSAAALCIAAGFAITFLYNVPVNRHLERWDYSSPPTDARAIWARWESAHIVRTIFWIVGFLLETVVLALTP